MPKFVMRRVAAVVAAVVLSGCATSGGEVAVPSRSAPTSAPTTAPAPDDTASVAADPAATSVPDEVTEGTEDPILRTGTQAAPVSPRPTTPRARGRHRIEIPKIGLSHDTFEGIDLPTINRGPSHWPGTALPGERGNTVFPGHRTTYTRPFWDIDKLVPGDEVIFTTPTGRFTYRVTDAFVVGSHDSWITNPTPEATFTIFACHPKGSARQRYVVKGVLTSPPAPGSAPPPAPAPPPTNPPPPPSSTTTTAPEPEGQPLLPGLTG